MYRNKMKKCAAAVLSVLLVLGTAGAAYAQTEDVSENKVSDTSEASGKAEYSKTENVYARLKADGTADGAYIVNHFRISSAGEVTDHGDYSNVINLTDTDELKCSDETVTFSAEKGNYYYQGNTSKAKLPWIFEISYQLDGEDISPEELGGRSGSLKISFSAKKNPDADTSFCENYLMQISLSLDNDICSDIKAEGATAADAGNNTQLSFTVLPDNDADFVIKANVENFEMSGFSIAAVPYNMNINTDDINTDDITSQFSELTDAVQKLNDGAKELNDGIKSLSDGGTSILDGSGSIYDGLSELSGNSDLITDSSEKIYSALETISKELGNADLSGLSQLAQLPGGLTQLADALDGIKSGLVQLKAGFEKGYSAIDSAISSNGNSAPTEEELGQIAAACAGNNTALSGYKKLTDEYKRLKTIEAVWENVKPAFEAVKVSLGSEGEQSVIAGLTTVSENLRTISDSMSASLGDTDIDGMLGELKSGMTALSSSYGDFNSGLSAYADGIDTLAENYGEFHSGLSDYTNGTAELSDGSQEFCDGMDEFADGVSEIPDKIQDSIDEMMEQYGGSDYTAVSFTDERNENISSVQFVISTDGVELPETEEEEPEQKTKSFWDRLAALFTGE